MKSVPLQLSEAQELEHILRHLVRERVALQETLARQDTLIRENARKLARKEGLCVYPSLENTLRRFS